MPPLALLSGRHLRSLQAFVYLLGFVVGFTANRANRLSRSCKVPKFLHPKRVKVLGGVVGKKGEYSNGCLSKNILIMDMLPTVC